MATYKVGTEENRRRAISLELEGWQEPGEWTSRQGNYESWPEAVVNGAVFLFTGQNPGNMGDEGTTVPDELGWHIAALIEDWVNFYYNNGAPAHEMMPGHSQAWYANAVRLYEARNYSARTWRTAGGPQGRR